MEHSRVSRAQEELDSSNKGYQPPLDESLVKEFDPEALWEVDGSDLSKNAAWVILLITRKKTYGSHLLTLVGLCFALLFLFESPINMLIIGEKPPLLHPKPSQNVPRKVEDSQTTPWWSEDLLCFNCDLTGILGKWRIIWWD